MTADEDDQAEDPHRAVDREQRADPFATIEDREGDPFDGLHGDERDDPFAELDDDHARGATPGGPTGATPADADRFDEFDADRAGDAGGESAPARSDAPSSFDLFGEPVERTAGGDSPPGDVEDPFDDLSRDRRGGDPFEGLGERSGGDSPDADAALWESLSQRQTAPRTERQGQRRFADVSKHSYCERCEHFSEPPAIVCSHEGTDIIEFLDSETVRVADCPIVAERAALADLDGDQ